MEYQRQRRAGRTSPSTTSIPEPEREYDTPEYAPTVRRYSAPAVAQRYDMPARTPQQIPNNRRHVVEQPDVVYDEPIRDIQARHTKERKRRSVLLLISAVLGVVYAIYITQYWIGLGSTLSSSNFAESFGSAIILAVIEPHAIAVIFAALFNISGWLFRLRWLGIIAGILYIVAALQFTANAPYVIVQPVLCFVAFAKMTQAKRKL
ncbi:hypothetical protein AGMMS49992_27050 [Clostridia bacterium]|nr:hypothetical protein AGMMS49992_27050 [Clostridia bacterium]